MAESICNTNSDQTPAIIIYGEDIEAFDSAERAEIAEYLASRLGIKAISGEVSTEYLEAQEQRTVHRSSEPIHHSQCY